MDVATSFVVNYHRSTYFELELVGDAETAKEVVGKFCAMFTVFLRRLQELVALLLSEPFIQFMQDMYDQDILVRSAGQWKSKCGNTIGQLVFHIVNNRQPLMGTPRVELN